MAANNRCLFLLVVFLAAAGAATASSSSAASLNSSAAPTAYEMLERYGFPRGILPEGVQRYELRPDGSFEVFLSGDGNDNGNGNGNGGCEFRVGGRYLLRYDQRIAGTARPGSIRALEGVSVKVLFVWLRITQVDRAGDRLRFLVGPLAASFPLRKFARSPRCRCAFDCAAAVAAS